MFNHSDFRKWIKSVHQISTILEGRHDVYPVCRRWVEEWYVDGQFTINDNDKSTINTMMDAFNFNAYRKMREWFEGDNSNWEKLKDEVDSKFANLICRLLDSTSCENIGLGIAPYLFTWNIQRFKQYFKKCILKREDFELETYFIDLGKFIEELKSVVIFYNDKKLYLTDIEEEKFFEITNKVNGKLKDLGIGQNEPVGSAKVLHMLAPYYFPLIDNPIAKATKLLGDNERLTIEKYPIWTKHIKECLERYDHRRLNDLENEMDLSILKLIDEGFFMMSSINLSLRVEKIGFNLPD